MLIATDLDGTLLPNGAPGVSARSAAALAMADRAGVPVVFVTARPLRWMEHLWPHVGRQGRAIVSNGAVVYDVPSRSVVRLAGIEPEAGLDVAAAIRAEVPSATFAIECLDGIRVDPHYDSLHELLDDTPRGPLERLWDAPALKLLVRQDPQQTLAPETFHLQVSEAVGEAAVCTWSSAGLVEISAPGVTKATALRWLAAELGVDRDDVVVFGDMPNDVPMLRWAGTSYAVEGAHPAAVAAADLRAPSCHEDGVAVVIERLLEARDGPTVAGSAPH